MLAKLVRAGLLTAVITAAPALAQDSSTALEPSSDGAAATISPLRLAAGVREYPAHVLRSLLQLAGDPLMLRQLADEPELLERPENISPPVSAEMHAAIRELSVMPAIVAVTADHPAELRALRDLYAETPEKMEESILQLRAAYDQAGLGAAVAWQEALERDPAALEEYSELVTRFCKAQREAYEGYPSVQVLEREYYYACPPNEAIIFYAIENAESSTAMQVIEQWWELYAPYALDSRILGDNKESIEFEIGPNTVAAMPPTQRASMWKEVEGDYADSVDLVPVIMQPPVDQPPEAYYARAVAEHARLWTPEMPLDVPEELSPDAPVAAPWDIEAPPTEVVPDIAVEDAGTWPAEDQGERVWVDDSQYIPDPLEEVVYEDDDWDYASTRTYDAAAYARVSYYPHRTYYAPIVVYYRGYPIDWPLFHGCNPSWLVRLRICSAYFRCGFGVGAHRSYYTGLRTTRCFNYGSRTGYYHGYSHRHGYRGVVRVGRRYYYRCAQNQIADILRHRRSHHGRTRHSPEDRNRAFVVDFHGLWIRCFKKRIPTR